MQKLKRGKNGKAGKNPERSDFLLTIYCGFLILALPFFLLPNSIDYTMMPRFLALNVFLVIFSFLYLRKKPLEPDKPLILGYPLFFAMTGYVVVIIASMFFSINVREGIYDLLKAVNLVFLTMLGALLFIRDDRWQEHLAKFSTVSLLISAAIGLTQYYVYVINATTAHLPDGRPLIYHVEGVMSHKNLFSLSILMFMPWAAYGIYKFRNYWRNLAVISEVVSSFMILLLQTRAVWMGVIITTLLVFILFFVFSWNNVPKRFRILIITVALLSGLLFGGILIAGINRSTNPYVRQFMSIIDPSSVQNVNRLKSWSLTTEMIRDHFITGVGAGNWQIVAPHYYTGKFSGKDELNWVRPHNDFLWVFSEKGLPGIALFLAIFGLSLYYLVRVIMKGNGNDKVMSLCIIWGICGYMVASVFDFPYERPFHIAALSLFFSGAVALYSKVDPNSWFSFRQKPVVYVMAALSLFSVYFGFACVKQEILVRKSLDDAANHDWPQMLEHARMAETPLKNLDPWANPVSSYIGKACEEMNDLGAAEAAYLQAYAECPTKMKVIRNLARIYEKNGRYPEAEQKLDEGLKIIPFHGFRKPLRPIN